MGCLQSKKEISDLHPNVFRVVNIDENGSDLCTGQLEITESDIILYREGRDSTVWPLHSLRRYGFEGEIFSFESGKCGLCFLIFIYSVHFNFNTMMLYLFMYNIIYL